MNKLLLVDDERIIVDTLYGYLTEAFELEIHRAYSAFEAIERLRGARFDLVVSDICMPGMDGLELLEFIRQHWPACKVIVLTGYDDFAYAYRAHQYKDVDFILKIEPFETLRKAVADQLNAIRREQQNVEYLSMLGKRITRMLPLVRQGIWERLLREGMSAPSQAEFEQAELPLQAGRPVLLAVGQLCEEADQAEASRAYQALTRDLEREMRPRGLETVFRDQQERAVWLIQQRENGRPEPLEDLAVYVRETFFRLHGLMDEGEPAAFSVVIGSMFVPWPALPALYADACLRLQRLSDQGGAMTLKPRGDGQLKGTQAPFLSVEDLHQLISLFRQNRKHAFLQLLSGRLDGLRFVPGPVRLWSEPATAALALLAADLLRAMEIEPPEDGAYRRFLAEGESLDGAAFLHVACDYMASLFERRLYEQERQRKRLIEQVDAYIEEHYARDLSLSELAEHVHYNPSYLSRLYKEVTGTNLLSHISEVRLENANRLLRESDAPVSEIAKRCGFFSVKYFHQVFRKAQGTSPAMYRQNARLEKTSE